MAETLRHGVTDAASAAAAAAAASSRSDDALLAGKCHALSVSVHTAVRTVCVQQYTVGFTVSESRRLRIHWKSQNNWPRVT